MTSELNKPEYNIPPELEGTIAITTLDRIYNWGSAILYGRCSLVWLAALLR